MAMVAGAGGGYLLARSNAPTFEAAATIAPPSTPGAKGVRATPDPTTLATERELLLSRALLARVERGGSRRGATPLELRVRQTRGGRLVLLARASSAQEAARLANDWASAYVAFRADLQLASGGPARAELDRQIRALEMRMAARSTPAPAPEGASNEARLAEQLSAATSRRLSAEQAAATFSEDAVVPAEMRAQQAIAAAEHAGIVARYGADYPSARAAQGRVDSLRAEGRTLVKERRDAVQTALREAEQDERDLREQLAQATAASSSAASEAQEAARQAASDQARLDTMRRARDEASARALTPPPLSVVEAATPPASPLRGERLLYALIGACLGAALWLLARLRPLRSD